MPEHITHTTQPTSTDAFLNAATTATEHNTLVAVINALNTIKTRENNKPGLETRTLVHMFDPPNKPETMSPTQVAITNAVKAKLLKYIARDAESPYLVVGLPEWPVEESYNPQIAAPRVKKSRAVFVSGRFAQLRKKYPLTPKADFLATLQHEIAEQFAADPVIAADDVNL